MKFIITLLILCSCFYQLNAQGTETTSIHLEMGIPLDGNASNDYLIIRPQYALSYNQQLNIANWVSWNLHRGWYGDVPRFSGNFIQDTSLPAEFYRVKHGDYTGSGYDRGHMVRSEERTATAEDNKSTFLLTNIMPQTPTLNQQTWLSLELECERMCKNDNKELFVMAGGVFGPNPKRLNTVVAVPDSCWKIIVILDSGQRLKDITPATRIIAVMMNNGTYTSGKTDWKLYTTTVDAIEERTGYDFLSDVPMQIQQSIESKNYLSIVDQVEQSSSLLYPQPVSSQFTMKFSGMTEIQYSIQIIDMLGSIVESLQTIPTQDSEGKLMISHDISHLPSGVYTLLVKSEKSRINMPLLKLDQ
ncbi:MAG: DNA/RNA non-specific endonuclease [Candidatus Kapaibacteriota bacterium]